MSLTLKRTIVPAMTVVALQGTVPTYTDEPLLWSRMTPLLHEQGITPIGPCGVIEHVTEYVERDVELSIFLPVEHGAQVKPPLTVIRLPERECLVVRVIGPYAQISGAHELIDRHATAESLDLADGDNLSGKRFNLYLVTPDQASQSELVTEVCAPLASD